MSAHAQNALVPILALIGFATPLAAVADVTVQIQTTVNVSTVKAHSVATHRISGDKERSETDLRCDGLMSTICGKDQRVDIVRLDRGVTWTMEPKKKRYTETSFPTAEQRQAAAEHLRVAAEKQQSCPVPQQTSTVDTSKCELTTPQFTMDKTDDVATLAGHGARRTNLRLTQNCKTQDPSQACELTYSLDVWLTLDPIPGLDDQRVFERRYLTQLGLGDDSSAATSAQLGQYLAPYAAAMKQLSGKSDDLKGYPLKSSFRLSFSGTPCGAAGTRTAIAGPGALSNASAAAVSATASSSEHAAGWGTADAVARSTGSGVGGYIAGSAAGAFTGNLVGGLFARKPKPDPKPVTHSVPDSPPAATTVIAEVTTETTSLSADTIPGAQFDPPAGWTKLVTSQNGESALPRCPKTGT